ncbi:MAG: hypothetical protein EXQ92_14705 [Alphaproteobacteria bacterium]|nr:hypothetical protein [Alphaproteobacteria bacterium]
MTTATYPAKTLGINRRQALTGAMASAGLAVAVPATLAQQAASKVFRDLTQDELDRAYDQRV